VVSDVGESPWRLVIFRELSYKNRLSRHYFSGTVLKYALLYIYHRPRHAVEASTRRSIEVELEKAHVQFNISPALEVKPHGNKSSVCGFYLALPPTRNWLNIDDAYWQNSHNHMVIYFVY